MNQEKEKENGHGGPSKQFEVNGLGENGRKKQKKYATWLHGVQVSVLGGEMDGKDLKVVWLVTQNATGSWGKGEIVGKSGK